MSTGPFLRHEWEAAVLATFPTARIHDTYHGAVAMLPEPKSYRGLIRVGMYDRTAKNMCHVETPEALAAWRVATRQRNPA